ncbi:MAG: DUF488 domain-containing protein [Candidatus Aminicenantes bacterium]|nr:DUF488 domain-containing protein [Candidatus Aminicenantes bacterium]
MSLIFNCQKKIWEVGHSTLSWTAFLDLLKINEIECLIDIRRFPYSRLSPHFCQENLRSNLEKSGIEYIWMGENLGGFRQGGYESWMKTPAFNHGLKELEIKAQKKRTAIMCAEKYFGRCHRRFLIQVLAERGWKIHHLVEKRGLL